jgi:hypothetical protein
MEDDLNCFANVFAQLLLDVEAGLGPVPEEAKNNQQKR